MCSVQCHRLRSPSARVVRRIWRGIGFNTVRAGEHEEVVLRRLLGVTHADPRRVYSIETVRIFGRLSQVSSLIDIDGET